MRELAALNYGKGLLRLYMQPASKILLELRILFIKFMSSDTEAY